MKYRKVVVHNNTHQNYDFEKVRTSNGVETVYFGKEQEINEYTYYALKDAKATSWDQDAKSPKIKLSPWPQFIIEDRGDWYEKDDSLEQPAATMPPEASSSGGSVESRSDI